MMKSNTRKRLFAGQPGTMAEWICFILLAVEVLAMAWWVPMEQCPDELARSRIVYWICEHRALPTGYEPELFIDGQGFTYASAPVLPALVSVCFTRLAALILRGSRPVFFACRLTSVFSLLGCYPVCLSVGRKVFRKENSPLLFAVLVCFTPQVIFCGSYTNCDLPALFGCLLILDALLNCRDRHWGVLPCVRLALSLCVVILSYYNAYGWVLVSVIWCLIRCSREQKANPAARCLLLKRFALVAGLILLLTGWFFLRCMILYDGDPTGLSYREKSVLRRVAGGETIIPMRPYATSGASLSDMVFGPEWMRLSAKSLIGVFGYMDIYIQPVLYKLFGAVLIAGVLTGTVGTVAGIVRKEQSVTDFLCLTATILIPLVLSVIYSYYSDYQPQGRYLFPALPALALLCTGGYEAAGSFVRERLVRFKRSGSESAEAAERRARLPLTGVTAIWLFLSVCVFCAIMVPGLIQAPRLKTELVGCDGGGMRVNLRFNAAPDVSEVRFAIWSRDDQSDLEWIPAELRLEKDHIWVTSILLNGSEPGQHWYVHVYGTDRRRTGQMLGGFRVFGQLSVSPG